MDLRSINFIKQLKFSFLFKVLSVIISFILVRYLLKYLDLRDYGLWSVIISFLNWIIFFDLGIANGVKNKLAQSLSENRAEEAKSYITTGYMCLLSFSVIIYLIVWLISGFISWQQVFNVYYHSEEYLRVLILIILFFTLSNFTLSLINAVFNALQRTSLVVINQFLSQVFSLLVLFFLIQFTVSDLHLLALGYGTSMFLSNVIISLWFFKKECYLKPEYKYYDRKKLKPIMSLGLRFFLLQLTMLIILLSDRFILVQLMDVSEVGKYDILYKYFSAILILHTLINAPLWSIYTEAYQKKDYQWIEQTMKNLSKLFGVYIVILLVMVLLGGIVIKAWLSNEKLNFTLLNFASMGLLTLFNILHSILAYFTNGIGKTKIQLYTSLLGACINIPLSVYFIKHLNFGLNGVLFATIISLSLFCFTGPFQVKREIRLLKQQVETNQ